MKLYQLVTSEGPIESGVLTFRQDIAERFRLAGGTVLETDGPGDLEYEVKLNDATRDLDEWVTRWAAR